MCKIHVVRDSGVQVLSEEDLLPKNRIEPAPKPVQKTTVQPKVTKPKVVVVSGRQGSVPRLSVVAEVDDCGGFSFYGYKRRCNEANHRRKTYKKVLRRTAMVGV